MEDSSLKFRGPPNLAVEYGETQHTGNRIVESEGEFSKI